MIHDLPPLDGIPVEVSELIQGLDVVAYRSGTLLVSREYFDILRTGTPEQRRELLRAQVVNVTGDGPRGRICHKCARWQPTSPLTIDGWTDQRLCHYCRAAIDPQDRDQRWEASLAVMRCAGAMEALERESRILEGIQFRVFGPRVSS